MRRIYKIVAVMAVVLGTMLSPLFASSGEPNSTSRREMRRELRKFGEVMKSLNKNHKDTLNYGDLVDRAIVAALSGCDPHSRYLTAEMMEQLQGSIEVDKSVSEASMLNDSVGYIKVEQFGREAAQEISKAIEQLGDINTLILDLRDNLGGVMEEAISTAGLFLSDAKSITRGEYRGVADVQFMTQKDGEHLNIRLFILINENSSSASEIVVSALQDHSRAEVLGVQSFGKGLILRPFYFGDGSVVYMAVGQYVTPSGRVIQNSYKEGLFLKGGVIPNIQIDSVSFYKKSQILEYILKL
ncbi:MAG: S41 family peptidase [Rikenellaceae bacterium]